MPAVVALLRPLAVSDPRGVELFMAIVARIFPFLTEGGLMALPWVRLDANIASHDKILGVLEEKPASLAYQAAFSYVCSLGYSGGHGTDGLIEFTAVPFVHGTKGTAELLVRHFLWRPDRQGWVIVNFDKRQQLTATTRSIRNAQRAGALRANCVRWHGADCGCWEGVA